MDIQSGPNRVDPNEFSPTGKVPDHHGVGNSEVSGDVQATLADRGEQYGDTWWTTGQVISHIYSTEGYLIFDRIIVSGYFHNWVQILGKLIRTLYTPRNPEHWRDIAGYAQLVLEDLNEPPK